jgi:hypothetical protein
VEVGTKEEVEEGEEEDAPAGAATALVAVDEGA